MLLQQSGVSMLTTDLHLDYPEKIFRNTRILTYGRGTKYYQFSSFIT